MDEVLRGIPNCFKYIDDILVFSENREKHLKHLSQVFNRLDHYGHIMAGIEHQQWTNHSKTRNKELNRAHPTA